MLAYLLQRGFFKATAMKSIVLTGMDWEGGGRKRGWTERKADLPSCLPSKLDPLCQEALRYLTQRRGSSALDYPAACSPFHNGAPSLYHTMITPHSPHPLPTHPLTRYCSISSSLAVLLTCLTKASIGTACDGSTHTREDGVEGALLWHDTGAQASGEIRCRSTDKKGV